MIQMLKWKGGTKLCLVDPEAKVHSVNMDNYLPALAKRSVSRNSKISKRNVCQDAIQT